jgi:DNA-binding PadR family transcriptional regulator
VEVKPSDVRLAGMDLLARREHSSQEIITKLKKRFGKRLESDAVIHDAVDQLTREGLLSDQRYAASMARQLVNRGGGPSKVAYALRQKGCDPMRHLLMRFQTALTGLRRLRTFTTASLVQSQCLTSGSLSKRSVLNAGVS